MPLMPRLAPLALAGALLLAACTPPAAGPSPQSEATNRWLARIQADSSAGPDSLAVWVKNGCQRVGGVQRECAERALYGVLERSGVSRAMATLDLLAERETSVRRDAHSLAHGLGIAAYKTPETVAATFAACPNTQISGCYHGVIQGYFLDVAQRGSALTPAQMNGICAPHQGQPLLWGQCNHGLGHGLMAMLRNQVPPALDRCDQLADLGAREACYGGVFMENIIAVTHPDHTAEGHAAMSRKPGADGHAGHGSTGHAAAGGTDHAAAGHGAGADHATAGHGTAAAAAWKPLDRDDLLYPCTVVGTKYRYQCYLIHTAAILPAVGGDIPQTAKACSRAQADMVHVCYASLGRDLTAYASRDPRRTAELCARAGAEAEPACIRGAAVALVDVNADPEDGLALCRVAPATTRAGCYLGVAGTFPIN
ncbi:MAG TPA: hypothetical protein VEX86_11780, partial [Longimicrobium sp.]|nr:hypothetical protein [Longimicrobium sp.]